MRVASNFPTAYVRVASQTYVLQHILTIFLKSEVIWQEVSWFYFRIKFISTHVLKNTELMVASLFKRFLIWWKIKQGWGPTIFKLLLAFYLKKSLKGVGGCHHHNRNCPVGEGALELVNVVTFILLISQVSRGRKCVLYR